MMMMKMIMKMMIRLMVDFGPFFVDSVTRKCGLKDHGVDLRTYGKVDLRTFCGLSIFFCGLNDFLC